jgi:hypothetical protein
VTVTELDAAVGHFLTGVRTGDWKVGGYVQDDRGWRVIVAVEVTERYVDVMTLPVPRPLGRHDERPPCPS